MHPVSEDDSLRFFELLISELKRAGYEHYEISNFALPDRYARHNTGYWQGVPYLGLGPSAHSFDGVRSRSHNVASLARYTKALLDGERDYETEYLSDEELQHEYILTRLRTQWGIPLDDYTARFGEHATSLLLQAAKEHLQQGQLTHSADTLRLTPAGIFVSDGIIADLFL